ncbi:MAG TPA: NADH-quinone oxidoreductase subunit C [Acidobacteriota bacterium]|nr:NADH-quinone oxidoreductase subunit C [Acidobacteriota bacterium]
MDDVSRGVNYYKLSTAARERREGDIAIQKRALELLQEKFGEAILTAQTMRDDITVTIGPDAIKDMLVFLRDCEELKYNFLSSLTGIDYLRYDIPQEWGEIRFGVVYNLLSLDNHANFAVRVVVPEGQPVPSIYDLWRTADWQEREAYDLLGIEFAGHPDLRQLFLYDDFEGEHPQRKDYPLKGKGERDRSWLKIQKAARGES